PDVSSSRERRRSLPCSSSSTTSTRPSTDVTARHRRPRVPSATDHVTSVPSPNRPRPATRSRGAPALIDLGYACRCSASRSGDGRRRDTAAGPLLYQVDLFEDRHPRLVAGAELVQDQLDRTAMLGTVRIRRVNDLEQHIGAVDLLERGPERVDELVRQLVDES